MRTILTAFLVFFMSNNLEAQTILIDTLSIDLTSKAKLLYETDKGLVYELPLDKMRCLVPTIQSDMPVAGSKNPGYIPNPLLNKRNSPMITLPLKNSSFEFQEKINLPNSEINRLFPGKK